MNMLEEYQIGTKLFRKGDVIAPPDDDRTRIFLVGFSDEERIAFGIQLTRDCLFRKNGRLNKEGWNIKISFDDLLFSRILMRDCTLQDIGYEENPIQVQGRKTKMITRKATPQEAEKYGIKTLLAQVEWFEDANVLTAPTVGINKNGISFNEHAKKSMQLNVGEYIRVGIGTEKPIIVFKKAEFGMRLRKSGKGMLIDNKRLARWLDRRQIKRKRYVIHFDETADAWYANMEEE